MRLVLPEPPSWNRAYRVGRGQVYTPDSVLAFRSRVLVEARNAGIRRFPPDQPVIVHLWWFRKRQAGDLDKRMGVALDALQGVWYTNDSQVVAIHAYREDDKVHPRLEVEVVAT